MSSFHQEINNPDMDPLPLVSSSMHPLKGTVTREIEKCWRRWAATAVERVEELSSLLGAEAKAGRQRHEC